MNTALRRPQQHAIARLGQMACLEGTGPHRIAPVLHELRRIIAFDSGGYFNPGDDGTPHGHVENPGLLAVMPGYFDVHVQRSEGQVLSRRLGNFSDNVARYQRRAWTLEPGQLLAVPRAELLRSDFHEAIMRPADLSTWAMLALSTPQGLGLGKLLLFRHTGAPAFSPGDLALLGSLEACLARVLQPGETAAQDGTEQAHGLLVVSYAGRLLWTTPEAERLLPLAFGWHWRSEGLPLVLRRLVQRVQWIAQGEAVTPLPQMEWRHPGGSFSLHATHLAAAAGTGEAIAIHITQHVACSTRVLAALQPLALPPRQHALACWMALGRTEAQIATHLGVSAATVVHHRRALYERLQVQDRQGLLALLRPPPTAPA
ncbi:MAG: helix-turn-helix transcriptional regulator [Comamonadaceae bacterium]|nr:helix-turn-helix transcriptional regulator [Comamonadaceae bacterium]